MTPGAFALKKSKKKTLVASAGFASSLPDTSRTVEKVFVTDFDPNALPALTQTGSKPLVIPLLQTNTWNTTVKPPKHSDEKNNQKDNGKNNQKDNEKNNIEVDKNQVSDASIDQQVAAAICAEVTQVRPVLTTSQLVIPLADKREKKRVELFQDGAKRVQDQQNKPLLQQNVVPGLDTLQDVADKYRHDVALRPDALDVLSDVYESVPVEAFGAALLRGMGWKGDETMDDEKQEALQPRHKLLGLGATKRPTLAGESQGKKKKMKRKMRKTEDGDGRSRIEDEDQRSAGTRLTDRERRCSPGRLDRRMRSRSESRGRERDRSRDRDRGRDRDRSRCSRSRSRSHRCRSDRRSRRR